jgi:hypothetical protein
MPVTNANARRSIGRNSILALVAGISLPALDAISSAILCNLLCFAPALRGGVY